MNILLINHYAGSPKMGMEFRPYYMAREWEKMGHKVLIVCASYSHVRSKQFDITKDYTIKESEGINYFIIKTPKYHGNNFGRVKNIYSFVRGLKKHSKKLSETFKPDFVIASSTYPSDIYSAHKISKLSKAKLIFEIHDLWPLSPMELGGYSKWHPFIMLMQHAENYAYKNCDKVVSILPKTKEHAVKHGLSPEKWYHIPNGIVVDKWNKELEIPQEYSEIINKQIKKGHQLIGYTGSHGVANALDCIINAMEILKNHDISLFLIGNGPAKNDLINLSKRLDLKNVFFLNSIDKELIPSILDKIDILYIGLQNQPLFRFGISPNKLIDYMMAGKPVIQAIKAGNDIVKEAECGISTEPENPEKISEAIIKLTNLSEKEKLLLGNNGKNFVLKNHNYKILAKEFIDIICR